MRKKKRIASVLIALALIVTAGLSFPGQSGAVRAEEDTDNITIVDASTQWQYRDDNQAPADGWKTSETVTETWKTAAGSFGAKNGVIADLGGGCTPKTLLNQYIEGTSNDIPVYYFRKTFDLEDPTIVQSVTGSLLYDDAHAHSYTLLRNAAHVRNRIHIPFPFFSPDSSYLYPPGWLNLFI